jgi:accessory gene regulator protein AgrB
MKEKFEAFAITILLLIVLGIFMAWPAQLLWNGCLIQAVDGLNPITFWQALGINILCGILFKNSSSSKD